MGPAFTATCRAALPLITDGPLIYCLSPGIHPPAGSYMFSAQTSTNDMLKGAVRYMREKGWRKIALMASTDATGQESPESIATAAPARETPDAVANAAKYRGMYHRGLGTDDVDRYGPAFELVKDLHRRIEEHALAGGRAG